MTILLCDALMSREGHAMFDRYPKPKVGLPFAARAPARSAPAPAGEAAPGLAAVPFDLGKIAFGTSGPGGRRGPRPNYVGLPPGLKAGVEALSGVATDDVRVRYRSPELGRLGALAFAPSGRLIRSTVIGATAFGGLESDDTIFDGLVDVADRDAGGYRTTYTNRR